MVSKKEVRPLPWQPRKRAEISTSILQIFVANKRNYSLIGIKAIHTRQPCIGCENRSVPGMRTKNLVYRRNGFSIKASAMFVWKLTHVTIVLLNPIHCPTQLFLALFALQCPFSGFILLAINPISADVAYKAWLPCSIWDSSFLPLSFESRRKQDFPWHSLSIAGSYPGEKLYS